MSQTPHQTCTQCGAPLVPGQAFCPNCGKPTQQTFSPTTPATPQSFPGVSSTIPATPYQQSNTPSSPYPPYASYPPTMESYVSGGLPGSAPGQMQQSTPSLPTYASTPSSPTTPSGSSYDFISAAPSFTPPPPPPVKKRSPLLPILAGIVALVVILGGAGVFALLAHSPGNNTKGGVGVGSSGSGGSGSSGSGGNNGGGSSGGGNTGNLQQVNVTTVYASDQITFTSIQQAPKFSDDDLTTYSEHPNYVRVNFKEQQLSKESSYFSYTSSFHLILPDNSIIASEKAQQYTGPDQAVVRTNWIDFGTDKTVDLSQLTLRLGTPDEAQMDIPLKTGADVSKYAPKTTTLNKQFTYATMNWTLKDATQSLSFNGAQAKTGQVYITADLVVNNPGSNELFLDNFVRLQAGGSSVAPDYGSDSSNFDIIKPATTNITGSVTFLVTPASSYTLNFLASSDNSFGAQSVSFQLS